ncbi:ankyrin [Choiromyces venosus 120613-1]|uniref:Ankyrin n=1 Tax=Choiromyces venosus 120613-1 TaxID=1336337 RepID=A0A3N4J6C9_9PEZI|nr:ankyrin [Choiromyces venosus 120613-1]
MSFLSLPPELLFDICDSTVLGLSDIASVLRTCHRLESVLGPLAKHLLKRPTDEYCKRALFHAAERQDHCTVRFLLDRGILDCIKIGRTILNVAVLALSEEGVTTLLDCGVDPHSRDRQNRTPLICATMARLSGAVRALLNHPGVDVNRTWRFPDFTALHLAVWNGYEDMVRLLLACPRVAVNKVDNIPGPMIERFPRHSNRRILRSSLWGLQAIVGIPLTKGWAPLHGAVDRGDQAILSILLENERVDVNILNIMGETPLWMAVGIGDRVSTRQLLLHPRIQTKLGTESILYHAIPFAEKSMIEIIMQIGRLDINAGNNQWQSTALHRAASFGRSDVVEMLLCRNDIDIRRLDQQGYSARALALGRFPEISRRLAVWEIEHSGMRYLDLALRPGMDASG